MDSIKKFDTYLPLFSGFYYGMFDADYLEEMEYDWVNEQRVAKRLEPIDCNLEFNYQKYRDDVGKSCCYSLEDIFEPFPLKIKFQSISSPQYYNYSNDSINCEIELDVLELQKYMENHLDEFSKYLKENYTSRDGFISYQSNYMGDWVENTNNFTENMDGHILGSILTFICKLEKYEEADYYYSSEIYLDCENGHFYNNAIQCPECNQWFESDEIVKKWNDQIDKDLEGKEFFGVSPKLRPFKEWMINNELTCDDCR